MQQLMNLAEVDEEVRKKMEEQKIDAKKLLSKLATKSRKDAKSERCLYCNQKCTKFCNSHSVPASFLRNIAVDGKVYTTNQIIDLPLFDQEKGVNNSGTFHIICSDCDSKIFSDYENMSDYRADITSKMVAQIAMKNHLKNISKRRYEIALYENGVAELKERHGEMFSVDDYFDQSIQVSKLDLNEYIRGFRRAKKVIEKKWEHEYTLVYCKRLNYSVPIAFQSEVALHYDFKGHIINNVAVKDPKYKIKTIHIAAFPLKVGSVVMLFADSKDKRYRPFFKQFLSLEEDQKLAVINYLIFSLSEDVYLSKDANEIISNDEQLKKVTGQTPIQFSTTPEMNRELIKETFNFSEMNKIPNLLLM